MEEQISTSTIIINVLIQIANLLIFFFAFKYFLGDKIAKALEEREHLIKKLKNAESEYNTIIQKAEEHKNLIFADAVEKQKHIIQEGEQLNKKLNHEILEDANKKADNIIKHATTETQRIQDELKHNRELAVKETTKSVVKKLLKDKPELQDEYLQTLIKDLDK